VRRATEPNIANVEVKDRLALTGEGLAWLSAALLLGVVGWVKSINLVLLLAYTMLVLAFLNGMLSRLHVRRIAATRTAHSAVYAGEETAIRVTATNTGTRPATVTIEDDAGEVASSWLVYQLAPGESVLGMVRTTYPTRGRFASSLLVSSGFPFGLIRCERVVPGPDLLVLPAAGVAEANTMRHWIMRQAGGDGRVRRVLRRVTTDQADIRGVRPYRPGDPIRGIHWRSTARRGELMVREYDAAPSPELVLIVEPWLPDESIKSQKASLEAALSLAVTVVETWMRSFGTRVTVGVAGDAASIRTVGPTDSAVRESLAPLAEVKGTTTFAEFPASVFDRSLQRAACVVVSSRRKSAYAAALTRTTGRPFVTLSAVDHLPWYQPPQASKAIASQKRSKSA
jgi:uncharacterized protein (DUF58 family)